MNILKSQIFGLLLAILTALGCIAYEKIVFSFSINFIYIIKIFELLFAVLIVFLFFNDYSIKNDFNILIKNSSLMMWTMIYIVTAITGILWFIITKSQGVMVGSIYEVKYIVMLAIIYYLIGDKKFSLELLVGVLLAIGSIYFISKS